MKIAIAGATGFLGQPLVRGWIADGHDVIVIGRDGQRAFELFEKRVKVLTWDGLKSPQGQTLMTDIDAVVNLSGASIAGQRWTPQYKEEILQSRLRTTAALVSALEQIKNKKVSFLNASAVGVYGIQAPVADDLPAGLTESSEPVADWHNSFLVDVCHQWENAALPARNSGHRVVLMRLGVILGRQGGALEKMALPFRLFAGGPVGTGHQPLCWISREDACRAINFLLKRQEIDGPVNLVAPLLLTQKEFAKIIGKVLSRPGFIPTPAFALKLILGEMAQELLLSGQNVLPQKLQKAGFMFEHPDVETALRCIYGPQ